jgi:hypothetical protein
MAMKQREDDIAAETIRLWGPIRPNVFEKLSSGLDSHTFKAGQVRYIQTLRSDILLYGYLLHILFKTADEDSEVSINALSRLESVEPSTLAPYLPDIKEFPKVNDLSTPSAYCLRFLTVSATAAAYIADRNNSDGSMAFALTVARNIPTCLLSWSYPGAFNKALSKFALGSSSLTDCIQDSLRFKYKSYIAAFGRNYPEKLRIICEDSGFSSNTLVNLKEASSKAHFFAFLGEAIGRLAVPELFPLNSQQLKEISATVDNYMGPHGLVKVQEKIDEMCLDYKAQEDVFSAKLHVEDLGAIANDTFNRYRCNLALEGLSLSDRVTERFRQLYGHMSPGEVSIESANELLTNVVPELGFSHSIVYFLDSGSGRLVPKIKKGPPEASVDQSVLLSESQVMQIVQTAIDSPAPITREQRYGTNKTYSYIAARFGGKVMSGVFFVQGGENLVKVAANERITRFQAARRALCDALNLSH